jgi:hypothetical protein
MTLKRVFFREGINFNDSVEDSKFKGSK